MKKRCLLVACLFFSAPLCLAGDMPLNVRLGIIDDVLSTEATFRVSDGSSVFTFSKDGTFKMEPLGVSGRTIKGVWRETGRDLYTIEGVWSWQNWTEDNKDVSTKERKRMVLLIEPGGAFSTVQPTAPAPASSAPIRVYQTYFCVEEVVSLDPKPSN